MIVDSHCHLDSGAFQRDRDEVIERARAAGVGMMLTIGTGHGPPELDAAVQIADRYPGIYATAGVHPHDAAKAGEETYGRLAELTRREGVLAVGEIGLDYYYDHSPRETQREVFLRQMALAREAGKPIIIHTRDAWDDTIELLRRNWSGSQLPCLMHCFTGNWEQAQQALDLGFYLAFGGVLTYKRSEELREAARRAPLDRMLVETDSPYLTPEPHRKVKRNEPRFVVVTAERLAAVRGVSFDEIAIATTANFRRLFALRAPS